MKGYKIGRGVSIGFGSVVCGEHVNIGDFCSIGFFTILRGKSITMGSHVRIGSTSFLDTPHISIGEGTIINEQVFVGGLQYPDSRFTLGRNCHIMQSTFINPARGIEVGDDSGIGIHCLLAGHSSWLSQLEGYPVEFAPIVIGRSVSLSWRVFVLPGTTIGDGAVIGGNSLVRGSVPGKCLAVGFPARVVSKAPEFPREISDAEKRELFREMLCELLAFLSGSGFTCHRDHQMYRFERRSRFWPLKKRVWHLHVFTGDALERAAVPGQDAADVFLSLPPIPKNNRRLLNERGECWIDVAAKERSMTFNDLSEEVLSFMSRYGIRTLRAGADAAV